MATDMSVSSGIFDIHSDEAFFNSLQRIVSKLRLNKVKNTDELLYLLMGVNHLRDWIAPGFNWKDGVPLKIEEHFGVAIFDIAEFKVVNDLCNRSKHMKHLECRFETEYGVQFDDYPEIDSVHDFDNGPPVNYYVDGRNLLDIIEVVLCYYDSNWYCRPR